MNKDFYPPYCCKKPLIIKASTSTTLFVNGEFVFQCKKCGLIKVLSGDEISLLQWDYEQNNGLNKEDKE